MKHQQVAQKFDNQLPTQWREPEPSTAVLSKEDELFSVARLIQAMSKPESCMNPNGPDFVKGDLVVYPQRYKIGDLKTPVSLIFLRNTLEWANFEVINGKEEWRSEDERIDGVNEDWPLEFVHDGKKMKRYRQITLYLLLPAQVEAFIKDASSDCPTFSGTAKPIAIKFRNYSKRAAQELLAKISGSEFDLRNALRRSQGRPPLQVYDYEHVFEIKDKTNPKGTFQILTYKGLGPVKNEEVKLMAAMAHKTISQQRELKTVVVDEMHEGVEVRRAEEDLV